MLNGEFIPFVQQKIIDVGYDNVRVLPRGGSNVVLFCPGKDDMMSVYRDATNFFNCLFTNICAWSLSEDIMYERGVWLRIYGVPLYVWHIKFLEFHIFSLGRFIKVDSCTSNLESLDFARILISTELLDTINVVENILINDKNYSIKIVEGTEYGFGCDVCFDDKALDSTSYVFRTAW